MTEYAGTAEARAKFANVPHFHDGVKLETVGFFAVWRRRGNPEFLDADVIAWEGSSPALSLLPDLPCATWDAVARAYHRGVDDGIVRGRAYVRTQLKDLLGVS